jgi:hypothetical protein
MCRLELDFIEKYSPKIFNQTAMDIIKDIPKITHYRKQRNMNMNT